MVLSLSTRDHLLQNHSILDVLLREREDYCRKKGKKQRAGTGTRIPARRHVKAEIRADAKLYYHKAKELAPKEVEICHCGKPLLRDWIIKNRSRLYALLLIQVTLVLC